MKHCYLILVLLPFLFCNKLFQKEGTAKDFDEFIRSV